MTISQLAEYAGVTVRTVRHYHQIGLMPEPPRDGSGYRRYGSDDVVRLVRIRGLVAAGVPLPRIGELLEAEPEEFVTAMAEVDAVLEARIAELEAHRARLARMTDPDAGVLGPMAIELFAKLREWGLPDDFTHIEREAAVLMSVLYPEKSEAWMRWQLQALQDPEVRAVYTLSAEAHDWDPDDPRIEDLARRSVAITMKHYPVDLATNEWWTELDATSYRLIDQHGTQTSPAWQRVTRRVEELMREAGYDVPD
ncbi:MerR family transcriptional regulator [Mariniluteicoccus endophyticus]